MWAIVWTVGLYLAWACVLAATVAYVYFRVKAVAAEGVGQWDPKQPFTDPVAQSVARRATVLRFAALGLGVAALVRSAVRARS
jgi:hypothetical protein